MRFDYPCKSPPLSYISYKCLEHCQWVVHSTSSSCCYHYNNLRCIVSWTIYAHGKSFTYYAHTRRGVVFRGGPSFVSGFFSQYYLTHKLTTTIHSSVIPFLGITIPRANGKPLYDSGAWCPGQTLFRLLPFSAWRAEWRRPNLSMVMVTVGGSFCSNQSTKV